jgi:hypothetical protein
MPIPVALATGIGVQSIENNPYRYPTRLTMILRWPRSDRLVAFLKPRAPTGGIDSDRKIIFVVETRHRPFEPRGLRRSPCPLLIASKLGPNMRRFGRKCDHVWTRIGDPVAGRRLRCSKTGRRSASDERIMVHEVLLFWGIVDFADPPNPDRNSGDRARDLAAINRTALISIRFRCQVKYFMLQATSGHLNSI